MLNVITCFEAGIEDKCVALYRSINKHVSFPDGMRIFGVSPRSGHEPSFAARAEAARLGVEYVSADLNQEFDDYPLANKPLSCAYIAEHYKDGSYLFLDSDTLFLRETDLRLLVGSSLSLRPVDVTNIGAASFDEPNGAYWKALYQELGIETPRMVIPATGTNEIFEYYNSGFVYTENSEIFLKWRQAFGAVMRKGMRPTSGLFFVEQSVLAAVISASGLPVNTPPADLNYPVHKHRELKALNRAEDIKLVRHIHYHHIFQEPNVRHEVLKALGLVENIDTILDMLDWPRS